MCKAAVYDAKFGPEPRTEAEIVKSEENLVGSTDPVSVNNSAEMVQMNR